MNYQMNENEEQTNLKDLLESVLQRKLFIIIITSLFALSSVSFALWLPNIYISESTLAPSSSDDSLSSKLGGVSALAGMAGIALPSEGQNKSVEAVERIESYDFFVNEFLPFIKLEDLIAAKNWDPASNKIIYDKKLFNDKENKWVRKEEFPRTSIPSNQEAHEFYREILQVSEDKKTSFISISIEHVSPHIAQRWVELIIFKINSHMKELDKELAQNSINFLEESYKKTNLSEIKDVISSLLANQLQTLMLAESSEDYVFKPISSPLAPEEKSKPNRLLICIFGTLFGFMLAVFFAVSSYVTRTIRS
tara:strand:- start:209 stop:1132 length:924 start_codon:yes stop_codon:yes gene_type:complete